MTPVVDWFSPVTVVRVLPRPSRVGTTSPVQSEWGRTEIIHQCQEDLY